MAEVDDIITPLSIWLKDKRKIALATVISTWGSSPRPVGGQMAIDQNGEIIGSVSGGCIEGAVITEGIKSLSDGKTRVKDYGISKEKWHISPTEVFSHSVNKELLKNITDDMQPEKIIVPVFNYQGDDTIIKRWVIYRKTHNLSEHASDKWRHFNITVQDVHLDGAIEFWKDSWAEYSKWVQQDNPYGNNVHCVDIEKLISGDNDEYLKLCEAINETPIDNIQEEITSYKNILLDVVADFDIVVNK